MAKMEKALTDAGYHVRNLRYHSRSGTVEQLGESVLGPAIEECRQDGATRIHFVTHSLGGILVRSYLAEHTIPSLGRVVMLAPPNQGSELVDKLGRTWAFRKICGPAGAELGTEADSVCNQLGAPQFDCAVIAGNRSVNWIESLLIPGRDDGKVSVERTKLSGMAAYAVIPATHPFIMRNHTAILKSIQFLRTGTFVEAKAGA